VRAEADLALVEFDDGRPPDRGVTLACGGYPWVITTVRPGHHPLHHRPIANRKPRGYRDRKVGRGRKGVLNPGAERCLAMIDRTERDRLIDAVLGKEGQEPLRIVGRKGGRSRLKHSFPLSGCHALLPFLYPVLFSLGIVGCGQPSESEPGVYTECM
jgi:hypothetical protein